MFIGSNVTLMVADMDRSVRFYTEALGLPLAFRAGNEWAQVQAPGVTIGLHPAREPLAPMDAGQRMSIGFQVQDIDASVAELQRRGVAIQAAVQAGGRERIVYFADPDGTPLYLLQLSRQ